MYECNKLGAVCCIMFTDALMGVCGVRWFGDVPALLAFKGTTASGWVYNFQSGDVSYRGWRRARHPCAHPDGGWRRARHPCAHPDGGWRRARHPSAHPDGGCLGVQFSPLSTDAIASRVRNRLARFFWRIFFSPKNIPISKNSSNFASFCVADGLKTNSSY